MIRTIELFSGTGGLALGLHRAGFYPTALIELDEKSCKNINANISNGNREIAEWKVNQTDIRDVKFTDYGTDIQFVTGGPPCQPFSIGGKHKSNSDSRDMFPEAVRAVRELKPQGFIFENVRGLLRKSFCEYFNYILLQLSYPEIIVREGMDWINHFELLKRYDKSRTNKSLEYNVVYKLLNAADYGVAQQRQRVIIVGFRSDFEIKWSFPKPTHSRDALLYSKYGDSSYWDEHKIVKKHRPEASTMEVQQTQMVDKSILGERWQTVRDAIKGLPNPINNDIHNYYNHEFRGGAKSYAGHSGSVLDEPSKTIKAGVHGVPGGENTIVLDNGSLRYYTVRESARIQAFPDNFIFHGSWTESMRQIGNAVPVKLASAIGKSVVDQITKNGASCYVKNRKANLKAV
jgi:DNA (cytosine-5)-methyltransferase 1